MMRVLGFVGPVYGVYIRPFCSKRLIICRIACFVSDQPISSPENALATFLSYVYVYKLFGQVGF